MMNENVGYKEEMREMQACESESKLEEGDCRGLEAGEGGGGGRLAEVLKNKHRLHLALTL